VKLFNTAVSGVTANTPQAQRRRARPAPDVLHAAVRAEAAATAPRTLWALTGFAIALLAGFAAAGAIDTRSFQDANVWLKPAKFALSFVVLFATLALVVERLSQPVREGRTVRATIGAMTLAFWAEMAYIGMQAGRAEASHFNVGTPLAGLLYSLMGVGAVTLVAGIGVIGVLAWRDRDADLGPGLRRGVLLGFTLSMVATLITAGILSSHGGHFVGTPSAGAAVTPLLGWSAEVGDLRPAHFLALHAMQALPLLGLWLDHRGRGAATTLTVAAAVYAALTAAVFVQALMGLPLLRL
jgi:hypothetical protein